MYEIIAEVTYHYGAEVVPPRKRTPEPIILKATAPVRLRVMEDEDFPLALRVIRRYAPEREIRAIGREAYMDAHATEMRWDGENLYSPAGEANQRVAGNDETLRAELSVLNNPLSGYTKRKVLDRADVEGRIIERGLLEAVRAKITAAADNAYVYAGKIWSRDEEPVWTVLNDYPKARIELCSPGLGVLEQAWYTPVFRADDLDGILAGLNGEYNYEPYIIGACDVLMPDVLRIKAADLTLMSSLKSMLKRMATELAVMPRVAVLAWLDFRDAVEAFAPEGSPWEQMVPPELARVVANFLDSLPATPQGNYAMVETAHLRRALSRWSAEYGNVLEVSSPAPLPSP